jgi:hypothetical protein
MTTPKPTIGINHVDGDIITATNWNNDVVQQGLWAQEVIAGTNTDKIPTTAISGVVGAYPNLLVNGGFEINQRGAGSYAGTLGGVLSLDRWVAAVNGTGTNTVSQAAGVSLGSQFGMQCVVNTTGGTVFCYQKIENYGECRGKTVWVQGQCSVPAGGSCFAQLNDGAGGANNSTPPMTTTGLNTFSVSLVVNSGATSLTLYLYMTVTGTYVWDNIMLCLSPAAIAYQPRPMAEEVALCNRYYQKIKVSTRWRAVANSEVRAVPVFYKQTMPGVPTTTLTAGTRTNVTSATIPSTAGDITADGCRVEYTATTGVATTGQDTSSLNDLVTLEYNI